jgi:hypothetical protein
MATRTKLSHALQKVRNAPPCAPYFFSFTMGHQRRAIPTPCGTQFISLTGRAQIQTVEPPFAALFPPSSRVVFKLNESLRCKPKLTLPSAQVQFRSGARSQSPRRPPARSPRTPPPLPLTSLLRRALELPVVDGPSARVVVVEDEAPIEVVVAALFVAGHHSPAPPTVRVPRKPSSSQSRLRNPLPGTVPSRRTRSPSPRLSLPRSLLPLNLPSQLPQ